MYEPDQCLAGPTSLSALTIVELLVLGRWDVAGSAMKAPVVPPSDPLGGRQLEVLEGPPGSSPTPAESPNSNRQSLHKTQDSMRGNLSTERTSTSRPDPRSANHGGLDQPRPCRVEGFEEVRLRRPSLPSRLTVLGLITRRESRCSLK